MENLSDDKVAQFTTLKNKLQSLGPKIKGVTEQGRLVATDSSQLFLFKGMYKELKSYFDTFNTTWDKIVELTVLWKVSNIFPLAADTTLQKNIERYYYEASAIYEMYMNPTPLAATTTQQSNLLNESKTVRARLPQINLPTFNGNQKEWPLFRDTYRSLIHDETSLSGIEKFLFLVSCLRDQPLALIKGIDVQEDNYEQAWKLLNDTYNDKRRLANNYLKTVLEFTPFRNRPSAANLKNLLTTVCESIDSFRQLKIPEADDFILFCLLLRCLDSETRRSFEKKHFSTEFPKYKDLLEFLRIEWRSLDLTRDEESSSTSKPAPHSKQHFYSRTSKPQTSLLFGDRSTLANRQPFETIISCPICKTNHTLYQCSQFRRATPADRVSSLKNWNGCKNCLSSKHTTQLCSSHRRCQICAGRHHTWLHIHRSKEDTAQPSPSHDAPNTSGTNGVVLGSSSHDGEVLLGTAIIEIKNSNGHFENIRAVIDSGSQHSFLTEHCASRLGLSIHQCHKNVSGIGHQPLQGMKGRSECSIRSAVGEPTELQVQPIIVSRITGELPRTILPTSIKAQYKSYVLADQNFWKPGSVDFLLGADLFYDIITGRPITVATHVPRLLPTIFGYVIGGPSKNVPESEEASSFLLQSTEEMKEVMTKFWKVEEIPSKHFISEEDQICEDHFKATHKRLSCGRYVVSLPLKRSIESLGNPKQQALSRLVNLEFKLAKNTSLKKEYHEFMNEYLTLGHMKIASPGTSAYTIPHHPVLKSQNGINKLRVVFDASCRSKTGSLNEHMYAGPKLQLDISDVISNFRIHRFVFTADIVKMYRQILLNPRDRKYQHILWRSDLNDAVQEFELCTVTYGEKASAFLAQRTIKQLVQDEGVNYPLASRVLLEDIYVDDIATGASTISDALKLKEQLITLLGKAGFKLSKWNSNCQALLDDIGDSELGSKNVALNDESDSKIKVLGIQWNPKRDVFSYQLVTPPWNPTKRAILSTIARIYDPLGFISPVVFYAKVVLQAMWLSKVDWDDIGPPEVCEKWRIFLSQLNCIRQVSIPRCFASENSYKHQIFGFCDASEKGYSAVIYLRIVTNNGIDVSLLKAKTKLSPIKPMTIPRLELSGALLLTRLFQSCKGLRDKLNITNAWFFTDSMVVLAWLSTPPENLKTFVAHRVVEILDATNREHWHYISSEKNPADCSSRGLTPLELISHSLWWKGPSFLESTENSWRTPTINYPKNLPEIKEKTTLALKATVEPSIMEWTERFNSYPKLVRVIAYMMRFANAAKGKATIQGPISVTEYRFAGKVLLRMAQRSYTSADGKLIDSKTLRSLQPFIDGEGCVRVGGRLHNSQLPYDAKHPYLLPSDSLLAKIIVDYYHVAYLHLSPSALRAMLQGRFWIIGARKLIRKRVFNCLKCYKAMRSPQAPLMGSLPPFRLEEGQVFSHVGVDFAFFIKESLRRKAAIGRSYLCLFICMATKAVHLELVSNCSTDAFLAAFERFVSRRGKPAHMYSDCGTNFVGAANRLKDLIMHFRSTKIQDEITRHGAQQEINWSFNPPSAPHFGGLWEAGIKSCKSILYKVIGEVPLTFEEFTTLFSRIESILNSRAVAPLESDTESIDCLTPGHFLIGKPLTALPEENILSKANILQRWKLIQQKAQHFWARWRMEYLNALQQRKKWTKTSRNVKVGELVIIKEPNCPMKTWPLARIVETHTGRDGVVRVVTLKTAKGTYKRPVVKIVPLTPVLENINEN